MQHDPIKAKIIELVPEIMGDWSGCDVCGTMCSGMCDNDEGPTARPITLADVLRAILATDLANRTNVLVESGGFISKRKWEGNEHKFISGAEWNLTADYDGQTQEVKEFIGKLLGV